MNHQHHDHQHGHAHGGRGRSARRLAAVLGLTLVYMLAEFAGGLLTDSLALLADAGHMLSDAAALGRACLPPGFRTARQRRN